MFSFVLVGVLLLSVGGVSEAQQRTPGPRLITEPGRYHANRGESVTLPCEVTNLARKSVFWLKGDNLESRELVMQIRGVRRRPVAVRRFLQDMRTGKMATQGTNLIINSLTTDDVGTYTCTVAWAGQSVTHVLEVTDYESPQKVVMEYLPPSKSMTVAEGSSVTFACHPRGSPHLSVSWYREGAESRALLREGPVMSIQEAGREDAGQYQCLTSVSADGQQEGTTFTLDVEYVSVRGAQDRVAVRTEYPHARLTCYVEGYPEPQVSWYRSSGQVTEGDRHRFVAARNLHHLEIVNVTTADLGEYQCYVHNGASRDLATVILTAIPGEAHVLGAELTERHLTYNVTWTMESVAPLRLYVLEYHKKGAAADQRNITYVGVSQKPQGMTYVQSGLLTLEPATTYEVRVRGVTHDNQQGPDMRSPLEFVTGGGTKEKIGQLFRTALPILSRLPLLARTLQ